MKRKLLFVLMTFFLGITQISSATDKVIVSDENGEKVSFLLSSNPEISFDAYDLILKTDQETVFYPITKFRSFSIESKSSDNVDQVSSPYQIPTFSFKDGLHAINLQPSSQVMVYNVTGMMIAEGFANENGSFTLSVNAQKNSICIVKTSVGSFKVCVR